MRDCVPLARVEQGKTVKLVCLDAGRHLASRLAALGMFPGAEVEVIQNSNHGPVIISLTGTRFVLGRGEAGKIYVKYTS
ncbi:MAG: FeoA family protein [Planctomycetota bacterium]|nr:FeoA family protein [Planctomycetota bacterium]